MVVDIFKRSLSKRSFVPIFENNSHNLKGDALFALPGASASFHALPLFRNVEFKIRVGDFDETISNTKRYPSSSQCSQARSESDIARLTSQLSATSEKMCSLEHETREKDLLILALSRSQDQLRSRLDDASDDTTQALRDRDLAMVQLDDALDEVENLKCVLGSKEAELATAHDKGAQREVTLKYLDDQVEEMRADGVRLRQTIRELEGRDDRRESVEQVLREEIAALKSQLAVSNDKCDALQAALNREDERTHSAHAYIAGLQDTLAVFEPEDRRLPVAAGVPTDRTEIFDSHEPRQFGGSEDLFVPRIALSVSSPSCAKRATADNGSPFISMLRCSTSAVLCATTRTNVLALSPTIHSFFTPSTPVRAGSSARRLHLLTRRSQTISAAASLASFCSSLALA
ncbi:hypothetical protein PsYK624_124170 [Phanerochaete sordida]|uniref:Uncharacterized protein n=1 Tax=Phanerochaete sordida TaxID=48140 RepID=A0A9P3LIJ2_9APHY|nr:hypothetical protein PsYK624_124170 [Phanerochaete sordida]